MNSANKTAVVALIALLGIVLAAGITWGTSQLVSQRIGLASEPLTAGRRLLAPALARTTRTQAPSKKAPARTTRTVTTTVRVPVTPPPVTTTAAPAPTPAPTVTSAPVERAPSARGEGSDSSRSAGRDD